MSLYDELAKNMGSTGLLGSITGAIAGRQMRLSSDISSALGGGQTATAIGGAIGSMAGNAATNYVQQNLSPERAARFDLGFGLIGDISRGDWDSAGMRLINAGALSKIFPGIEGIGKQEQYRRCATPVVGGITIADAQRIMEEHQATRKARKNLFLIEASSKLQGDFSHTFNMFCTGCEFSPITLSGNRHQIGSGSADGLNQSESVELSITTYDDEKGTLRRWIQKHTEAAAPSDGTVGVPGRYAIRFKIVHAFITRDSNRGGYEEIGLFRPANLSISLGRTSDEAEEMQMTFQQLDTFTPY